MKSRIVSMAAGAVVLIAGVATAQQTAQPAAEKQPAAAVQAQSAQPQAVQPQAVQEKGTPHGQGRGPKAVAKLLALTPEQQAGWKKIQGETAAAVKPLREKLQAAQQQLDQQNQAEAPDAAAVGKLTASIRDLQTQIHTLHQQGNEKFVALLNADQKTKFEAFEAAGKARRAAREQQQLH